mmetsp:Transcript_76183/g.246722  ORF Transcript_76183/g.246722 Transcript_76183/m.246722 type:complete len:295 (-) Transcript_76183:438-1322(-)
MGCLELQPGQLLRRRRVLVPGLRGDQPAGNQPRLRRGRRGRAHDPLPRHGHVPGHRVGHHQTHRTRPGPLGEHERRPGRRPEGDPEGAAGLPLLRRELVRPCHHQQVPPVPADPLLAHHRLLPNGGRRGDGQGGADDRGRAVRDLRAEGHAGQLQPGRPDHGLQRLVPVRRVLRLPAALAAGRLPGAQGRLLALHHLHLRHRGPRRRHRPLPVPAARVRRHHDVRGGGRGLLRAARLPVVGHPEEDRPPPHERPEARARDVRELLQAARGPLPDVHGAALGPDVVLQLYADPRE